MRSGSEYPKTDVLRRGVLLRSIVNAVVQARNPDLARFLSWDGKNYVLNNADGNYGAVTFEGANVIGAFFDPESGYSPYRSHTPYDREVFLQGMPRQLRSIAEDQTFRFNRQKFQGEFVALVTAATWSEGEYLTGPFPWPEVFANGAHIIRVELLDDVESELTEWQDAYQCLPEELSLTRALFERRLATPAKPVFLSESEFKELKSRSITLEALAQSLRALEFLQIRPAPH